MKENLYTGLTLPENPFRKNFQKFLVFELDYPFYGDNIDNFNFAFEQFYQSNNLKAIIVESLDINYKLQSELSGENIASQFTQLFLRTPIPEEMLSKDWNYNTVLRDYIMYSEKENFAFYGSRYFELLILGFDEGVDISMLSTQNLGITIAAYFKGMRSENEKSDRVERLFHGKEHLFDSDLN